VNAFSVGGTEEDQVDLGVERPKNALVFGASLRVIKMTENVRYIKIFATAKWMILNSITSACRPPATFGARGERPL
jgi:hypothetical protein